MNRETKVEQTLLSSNHIITKGALGFFDLLSRFKPFQRQFARRYVGKPAYFRLDLTYEANLKLRGEKVTGKGKTWCEFHKMV